MPRLKLDLKGADRLRARIRGASEELEQRVQLHVLDTALQVETDAKRRAPVNDGFLRRSIRQRRSPVERIGREVVTDAPYARAVEFGSRPHFPPVEPLERWAQKHPKPGGYEPGDGYAIALAISKRGTAPQPFLFPALDQNRAAFERGIRRILREID